jgi:hypothetical protein
MGELTNGTPLTGARAKANEAGRATAERREPEPPVEGKKNKAMP